MRVTKWKAAIAIVATISLGATGAYADHVFTDVPDDRFFADAAEWAKNNGMTTGCGDGTTFCPDDPVTRGENITFAKRYDDLVVQPALSEQQAEIDALEATVDALTARIPEVIVARFSPIDDWDGNGGFTAAASITTDADGMLTIEYTTNVAKDLDATGSGLVTLFADLFINDQYIRSVSQTISMDDATSDHTVAMHHAAQVPPGTYDVEVTLIHVSGTDPLVFVHEQDLVLTHHSSTDASFAPLGQALSVTDGDLVAQQRNR